MGRDGWAEHELSRAKQAAGAGWQKAKLVFAPTSEFAKSLQSALADYAKTESGGRFANLGQWAIAGLFGAIGIAAYATLLFLGNTASALLSLSLVAITALAAFMQVVLVGHDAAHGSFARARWVNRWAVFSIFSVLGVSGALWRDRHLRLHHPYPNLPGTGIDADGSDLVRLAPDKPWRRHHRLQRFYGPPLFAVGLLQLAWVEDFQFFRDARRSGQRAFSSRAALAEFVATKLLHLTLVLVLPAVIGGFGLLQILLGYLLASAVISLAFAALVIGTHVSDLADFPLPDSEGRVSHDWATHQLVTSVDWSPTSRLAAALSGGANAHTAHHLFPGYSHCHAPKLAKIVIDCAAAHGLRYRPTSFFGMLAGQLRHVSKLGAAA